MAQNQKGLFPAQLSGHDGLAAGFFSPQAVTQELDRRRSSDLELLLVVMAEGNKP